MPFPAKKTKRITGPNKIKKMSGQQRLFCRFFYATGKGKLSALKAGYSPHSAAMIASQLLNHPKVVEELERLRKQFETKTNITKETLLKDAQFLKQKAMYGEAVYDEDGELLDIVGMDDKSALAAIQTQARLLGIGGFGGTKLEVSGSIEHNHKHEYDLTALSKEERLNLIVLLSKCRKKDIEDNKAIDTTAKEIEA